MSDNNGGDVQKCQMCCYTSFTNDNLISHIVKHHRYDPKFHVKCIKPGCSATFKKWRSFQQHLYRKHSSSVITETSNVNITAESELGPRISPTCPEDSEDFREEINQPSTKSLEWYAAKFVVDVRENCKVSQNAIEHIIDNVIWLLKIYSSTIIKECEIMKDPGTGTIHMDNIQLIHTEIHPPDEIFAAVNTQNSLNDFLVKEMNMIEPEEILISRNRHWKKKNESSNGMLYLKEICHNAYHIPFIDNLRELLMNSEIRDNVDNPLERVHGTYRTVLDGNFYQENPFFRDNQNSLAIILYYDDLGITNPSSSSAKVQKLSMFYWTLANIRPKLRSSQNAIQLLTIVKTKFLKEPSALEKILRPFIDGIIELQTTGIDIVVNNSIKNYKGSLLFFSGDTPAAALIGGFKESVAANHPCRSCMIVKTDIKNHVNENNLTLRNLRNHNDHLSAIEEPTLTKGAREFWQKSYGVNSRSPLMRIPFFDITQCLPQDCMHILIEGVTEISCRVFLWFCIQEKKIFSLEKFNKKLLSFDYGHLSRDKPGAIYLDDFAPDKPLRQSAAQMIVLSHMLPFLLEEWILNTEDVDILQRHDCYILVLQIMNLSLAYIVTEESIDLLSRVIEVFLTRFILLYPGCIVPKFHFLTHVPRYMKLFGPGRQQWCFRFESAHAYYKSLVSIVRNFKNMPYTMCTRQQARLCTQLITYPGQSPKKILYEGDIITAGPIIFLKDSPYVELLNNYVDESVRDTYQYMQSPKIIIHGVVYKNKTIVLLENDEDSMPIFGEVCDISIIKDTHLLVVTLLETIYYEHRLNAYEVIESTNKRINVVNVGSLIFPHSLSKFRIKNAWFIPLINFRRCEFLG